MGAIMFLNFTIYTKDSATRSGFTQHCQASLSGGIANGEISAVLPVYLIISLLLRVWMSGNDGPSSMHRLIVTRNE
eukprot:scaffold308889_cov37-Prasinocladus_malaysianus.AAC.1